MPVMCPPSLTKLCRYLFIKESVRFPAGSGRLLFTAAEQQPENGTAQRAAVQHLPAQGHGHVAAQVCTQVPKLGSLNSSVATRLITGHMRNTPHAIGPAASSRSRGFPQEGSKVGQSAQKRRSADRFCCIYQLFSRFQQKFVYFFV